MKAPLPAVTELVDSEVMTGWAGMMVNITVDEAPAAETTETKHVPGWGIWLA